MEALSSTWLSIAVSCICIGIVALSWRILEWIWLRPKRLEKCFKDQGFQGNPYRIFYGDTKDTAKMVVETKSKPMPQFSHDYLPRVLPFLHQTITNYGKKSIIWNGPIPLVNILEPEQIREVLLKMDDFQKIKTNPIIKKVATGLVILEGEEWANHRKLINPAFHLEKIKAMLPIFYTSTNEMIKKWDKKVLKTGSHEVDASLYMFKLTADIISRAAFGSNYEEGKTIFELISEQLIVAIPVLNSVYIPGWRFVPTKANKRIININNEIKSLLKGIIIKRKKAINDGEKTTDDLLGVLLHSSFLENNLIENDGPKSTNFDLEDVMNECKVFYLAGQETTSVLLLWTLIMLGKHQGWQARAREEVLTIFGTNDPDFHGLNKLKIVNMILQEVLRLYPPAVAINRVVCKDIKLQDIFLPAGVLVNLPILHVHQDEMIWGSDAKEFNPMRFNEGISKATGGNMSFFSFGWGPRVCIGSNFAMIQAKLILTMILQNFSFENSPSYRHAPMALSTLRPQFGAQIILHRLK